MRSFRHVIPNMRLFQGEDCLGHLTRELVRLKRHRAAIVCGRSIASGPLIEPIKAAVGDRCAGVYSAVRANSPLPAVEEAASYLREIEADAVIAVGGGSAIVTARAASVLLAEHAPARQLCTSRDASGNLVSPKLLAPKLPQIVIPSTPTTAIVKAGSAILDPDTGARLAVYDPKTRATSVFLHPDVINSAPVDLYLSAGVNTLTLAVEGLLSGAGTPISDALLIHAVRLLVDRLPQLLVADGIEARSELMMASILCGRGSDYTGAGLAIPLGHAICARYEVDNGATDAIVLPHVLRFNALAAAKGIEKLADALRVSGTDGRSLVESVVSSLQALFEQLGIPKQLRDIGVSRDSLGELAAVTMEDWFVRNNPRPIRDASEVEAVLEEAW